MAWSTEQTERDQDRQWAWVESWAGWDTIPLHLETPGAWNALHSLSGGGFPGDEPGWGNVPSGFWDWSPESGVR